MMPEVKLGSQKRCMLLETGCVNMFPWQPTPVTTLKDFFIDAHAAGGGVLC
jgi:hypothetical protein